MARKTGTVRDYFETPKVFGPDKYKIDYKYQLEREAPPVYEEGGRGEYASETHRHRVLNYFFTIFSEIAADEVLVNFHENASRRMAFYQGYDMPNISELSQRKLNIIRAYSLSKYAQLASDPLEVRYIHKQDTSYDLAEGVTRLLKYHERLTRRKILRMMIETAAPIYGSVGVVWYPGENKVTGETIPAKWQYLEPTSIYVKPAWRHLESAPAVIVVTVEDGRLMDTKFKHILKKRGLKEFPRGTRLPSSIFNNLSYLSQKHLKNYGNDVVQMFRVWIRDDSVEKTPYYNPVLNARTGEIESGDTPIAQAAREQATNELPNIIKGSLPQSGENHHNHLIVNKMQLEIIRQTNAPPEMVETLETHCRLHEELLQANDQRPDGYVKARKFNGGYRNMLIVGDELIFDGSIDELNIHPQITIFSNGVHPESIFGYSDIDDLMRLSTDINMLLHLLMEVIRINADPPTILPHGVDAEKVKWGPGATFNLPKDVQSAQGFGYVPTPPFPEQALGVMSFLINMGQSLMNLNETSMGIAPQQRTSGSAIAQLQAAAERVFSSTQNAFTEDWADAALKILDQWIAYGDDEIVIPVLENYREMWTIIKSDLDPNALMEVERIRSSRDIEMEKQNEYIQDAVLATKMQADPISILRSLATVKDCPRLAKFFQPIYEGTIMAIQAKNASTGLSQQGPQNQEGMPQGEQSMVPPLGLVG